MGKRKSDSNSTEQKIQRKIKKLQEKLTRRKRRRIIYSEDDSSNSVSDASDITATHAREENTASPFPDAPMTSVSPTPLSPPPSPLPQPGPSLQVDQTASGEQGEDLELESDILKLLGDAPKEDALLGPAIHKDVASRWQEVLMKGLSKEIKGQLLGEYLVPSNCTFLLAPSLNPEAKAALSEPLVKRDTFLMQKQKQLGVALSALATTTSLILANETSKQKLLKPISDACRILCDNHFMETKSRRNLVISATNTQLKDTLVESPRDKSWLFGENISEKLKAAKSIQKSGNELKTQSKQNLRVNFTNKNTKGRLNFKPLHRKTDKPSTSNDSGRSRQPPPRTASSHRSSRRSPAPRRTVHK